MSALDGVTMRSVPTDDEMIQARCRVLMDELAEAQGEMASALDTGDVAIVKAAGRRLMSIGWLFKEAGDKHTGALLADQPVPL